MNKIIHGIAIERLKEYADNSIDAIVTDPPYGISFMGKKWDYDVPDQATWEECLRVLKPGGYLLAFAGTRTQHRMAVRIEDAGFEIRDMIGWIYGSGFPKSLDVSKAIDKKSGVDREDKWEGLDRKIGPTGNKKCEECGKWLSSGNPCQCPRPQDKPQSDEAKEWEGWGTALKPAMEPITVARKPLSEKTIAENILKWGTGGMDIDGSRVEFQSEQDKKSAEFGRGTDITGGNYNSVGTKKSDGRTNIPANELGRFPANVIHDGSDEVLENFPNTKSGKGVIGVGAGTDNQEIFGKGKGGTITSSFGDSAARFFYCAKASQKERNFGCEGLDEKPLAFSNQAKAELKRGNLEFDGNGIKGDGIVGHGNSIKMKKNNHPTVKPVALMEYLVKLVSKEGATVLDPFGGSGSTAIACINTKRNYIIIEREEDYIEIIKARTEHYSKQTKQGNLFE